MSKEQPKPKYRLAYVGYNEIRSMFMESDYLSWVVFCKAHGVNHINMNNKYQFISKLS